MTRTVSPSPELVDRLRKRAEIRRQIPGRKSVMEGAPDRISDLLEEAADALESTQAEIARLKKRLSLVAQIIQSSGGDEELITMAYREASGAE